MIGIWAREVLENLRHGNEPIVGASATSPDQPKPCGCGPVGEQQILQRLLGRRIEKITVKQSGMTLDDQLGRCGVIVGVQCQ